MLGSTKIYGCLADPIDHVKAPTIFTSIFKEKNIDAVMVPIHVKKENLKNVIKSLKKIRNFEGMTVTIPHKKTMANICDHLEQDAVFTQSVNWIKFDKDRKLIGNNFDGQGFVAGFLSQNFLIKNKKVCIFGAGGAAVSIACSLAKHKIKSLQIINRNFDKAYELINKIKIIDKDLLVEVTKYKDNYLLNDYDIIINATSLGLHKDDKLPFDVSETSSNAVIADIIMQPLETKLLKKAKKLGRPVLFGKYMIESQIDLAGNFLDLW
ncbi:MAG: hypothetical protein CBD59_03160 [Alphaproteobacteria bacterium TMED199]|nr:MAG: hypothetical protein CBD59_03160 [Alphaproteobacteria bacterium TMED199]